MESFTVANPIFIPAPFARDSAYKNTIQKTRQSGQDQEDMTWTDGAPLITMTPKDNGGLAPKGQDFNGVLNAATENIVFVQNGGRYKWSSDVVANYGGYAKDAIVQSDNGVSEFISLVDNNTVNPNSTLGTSWAVYAGQGSIPAASSTIAGVTKVLNNLTSTDTGSALSAAQGKALNDIFGNFSFTASAAGELKIPVGDKIFIAKWGKTPNQDFTSGDSLAVTFPTAFPNSCFNIQITPDSTGGTNPNAFFSVVTKSKTGFTAGLYEYAATTQSVGIAWLAIGY